VILSLSLSLSQRRQTCSNSNVTHQHGYISCTIDVLARNHGTKSTSVHHKTNSNPTPNIFLKRKRTRTECLTFFGSSSSFVELRHFEASGQDGTQTVPKSGKIFTDAPAHTPNVARFYSPNTQITEQNSNTHACTKLLETPWKHKLLKKTQYLHIHKITTLETQITEEIKTSTRTKLLSWKHKSLKKT
jgi:hypothetical protein